MGFVNEYVSEEDIQKYKIYDLWNELVFFNCEAKMPEHREKGIFRYDWCIDRSRNCWLLTVGSLPEYNENAGVMASGLDDEFIFFYRDKLYRIILTLTKGSTTSIYNRPYNTVWTLKNIESVDGIREINDELITALIQSLEVYGRDGVRDSFKNDSVKLIIE